MNMSMKLLIHLVLLIYSSYALSQPQLFVSNTKWDVSYDKNGIKVYTKRINGSPIRAVRAITQVRSDLESASVAISNVDAMESWVPILGHTELLRAPDKEGNSFSYLILDLPWPLRNRDVLYKNKMYYSADKSEVYMYSNAVYDSAVKKHDKRFVRLPASESLWSLRRIDDDYVEIELIAHADPGGHIPKWFADLVVVDAPKRSLLNLRELLQSDKYRKKVYFNPKEIFGHEVVLKIPDS